MRTKFIKQPEGYSITSTMFVLLTSQFLHHHSQQHHQLKHPRWLANKTKRTSPNDDRVVLYVSRFLFLRNNLNYFVLLDFLGSTDKDGKHPTTTAQNLLPVQTGTTMNQQCLPLRCSREQFSYECGAGSTNSTFRCTRPTQIAFYIFGMGPTYLQTR